MDFTPPPIRATQALVEEAATSNELPEFVEVKHRFLQATKVPPESARDFLEAPDARPVGHRGSFGVDESPELFLLSDRCA